MAIPKINLIPPAFYLRKKRNVAIGIAAVVLAAEVAALAFFWVSQNSRRADLTAQQTEWQARSDAVAALKSKAESTRTSAQTVISKATFVSEMFTANAKWADIFDNIRRYTYPQVQYTTIKPTAGSKMVTASIRTPGLEELNLYWSNITRSPMIAAAMPSQLPGYSTSGTDAGGGGSSMPGSGMPGGPPGMPGGVPGGPPPVPGGMPGAPSPMTRANDVAGDLSGMYQSQYAPGGIPGLTQPAPRPTMQFDFVIELTEAIKIPTVPRAGAGAVGQADQTGLGGAPMPGSGMPGSGMPGGPSPMPGGPPSMPGGPPMPGGPAPLP